MIPLSMDLVRVTEAAAIAASAWIGTGSKELADKAATDAMRDRLNRIYFAARIVIGEGIKDDSFGLFSGEAVGRWRDDPQPALPSMSCASTRSRGPAPPSTPGPRRSACWGPPRGPAL